MPRYSPLVWARKKHLAEAILEEARKYYRREVEERGAALELEAAGEPVEAKHQHFIAQCDGLTANALVNLILAYREVSPPKWIAERTKIRNEAIR